MVTAEELLRGTVVQPNPEGHIIVGGDRFITVPSNLKRLAVQYDHNMETVVFDCPRYWDNRDMSQMAVYINYALSDGYMDRYPADNVAADGDIMHFEWTISRNVTQVSGVVSFLICVMKTDVDGNEERHWNSELCQECYISPGMETEESLVDIQPDLITQLLLRMDSVEKINIKADEMQELYDATVEVANVAEGVKNEALDASDYIKNTYANAIKDSKSGEIVRVDDVSPIEHTASGKAYGKNLFDISRIPNSAVVTNNGDGTISIAAGTYHTTTGKTLAQLCPALSIGDTCMLSFETLSPSASFIHLSAGGTWFSGGAKTITPEVLYSTVAFYGVHPNDSNYGEANVISNVQLERGNIRTEYEEYVDPSNISIARYGKNLAGWSNMGGQMAYHAATDVFTISGTGSRSVYKLPIPIPKGTPCTISVQILSGRITNPGSSGQGAVIGGYNVSDEGSSWQCAANFPSGENVNLAGKNLTKSMVVTADVTDIHFFFYASSVTIHDPIRCRVQFEIGDSATTYEKFTEPQVVSVDADGNILELTTISPTMTLVSDRPDTTIDVEYSVDTMTYLENCFRPTDEQVQAAVDAWLTAHYTEAEGASF